MTSLILDQDVANKIERVSYPILSPIASCKKSRYVSLLNINPSAKTQPSGRTGRSFMHDWMMNIMHRQLLLIIRISECAHKTICLLMNASLIAK